MRPRPAGVAGACTDGAPPTGRDPRAAALTDASEIARRHANVDIPTNATANIEYVYHYASKGEDGNVASIRCKEVDQASDEVCRPAAHGSPPIPRSTRARRPHPPYARQVEEYFNFRVYDREGEARPRRPHLPSKPAPPRAP